MSEKKEIPEGMKDMLRSQLRSELKSELQAIEQSSKKTAKPVLMNSKTWMGIAAGVLILIVAYFFLPSFGKDYSEIVAANFKPLKNSTVPIERGATDLSPLQEAFLAYEAEDYRAAVEKFEALDEGDQDANIVIYRAISYMAVDQDQSAIRALAPLSDDENSVFQDAAKWYLALAYLKVDKIANARLLLKQLAEKSNPYQARAEKVMEQI